MLNKQYGGETIYNYVMLIGRLTEDVNVSTTKTGKKVANILAINRPFKNPQTDSYDTDFIDVSIWDELCDVASNYLKKGSLVAVKGRLTAAYDRLESGPYFNRIQVTGERVIFLSSIESKKDSENK